MSDQPTSIVIIGGGFAGAVTALQLLHAVADDTSLPPLHIRVIESRSDVGTDGIGRGIAYSTGNPEHLVNGPAQAFSLYPQQQPLHLAEWLAANAAAHGWTPPADVAWADAFPPRQLFGSYVQDTLRQAQQHAARNNRARLEVIHARAQDLLPQGGGYQVVLDDGRRLHAERVVLALGLFAPRADTLIDSAQAREALGTRYIDNVWDRQAWDEVAQDQEILIIGTSLTALDAALSAERAGFGGRFVALSRRGLLVQPRRATTPWPGVLDPQQLPTTLRELLRATGRARRAVKTAAADWQQLPPAIRPHLPTLWAHASQRDRQRFLRHLRPFWEISLHRAAPASGARLEALRESGRLRQINGHIQALLPTAQGKVAVHWRARGSDEVQTLLVDRVVNARGHEFDWARIDDPLVQALQTRALVRRHATGFGIDAEASSSALFDRQGQLHDKLFAVGHALRGVVWESNSIPEQLAGAATTAGALLATLRTVETAQAA